MNRESSPDINDIAAFLAREARLIDEDRLEEWLELFTPDGLYWVPGEDLCDPEHETSIIYDDHRQRAKRVFQLRHRHLAQDPRSRSVHFITNIEIDETANEDGTWGVRCNQLIAEMRPGDHQMLQNGLGEPRLLACRCRYRLQSGTAGWRIAFKQVLLIDRDLPLRNISFIL